MYYLFKLDTHGRPNNSVFGYRLNCVEKSEQLEALSATMKKRVLDGCPIDRLLVFKGVPFEFIGEVAFEEKGEERKR